MGNSETQPSENSENNERWTLMQTKMRQIYQMGNIFGEMYKDKPGRVNHETGQVLFEDEEVSDTEVSLLEKNFDDEDAGQDDWDEDFEDERENAKRTETWLRVLSDGALEVQFVNTTYKQDKPRSLSNLTTFDEDDELSSTSFIGDLISETKRRHEEDPFYVAKSDAFRANREIEQRSTQTLIFRPKADTLTLEVTESVGEGDLNPRAVTKTYTPGDDEIDKVLYAFYFNLQSDLYKLLNSAVASEDPEKYATFFPLSVRKQILHFAVGEMEKKDLAKMKETSRRMIRVQATYEFHHEDIVPGIEFFFWENEVDDFGYILRKRSQIWVAVDEVYFADQIDHPPILPKSEDTTTWAQQFDKNISEWQKQRINEVGQEAYEAEVIAEVEKLTIAMLENTGSVHGQAKTLTFDHQDVKYYYRFVYRQPAEFLENRDRKTILKDQKENPENPSCDELALLVELALIS